jgi:hypothetical protein
MRLQTGMIRFHLCIFLAVSCIAIAAAAEKSIDFSGTWTIDPTQTQVKQISPEIGKLGVEINNPKHPSVTETTQRQMPISNAFPIVLNAPTLQILQTANEIQIIRQFSEGGRERTIMQKFKFDGSQCLNVASNGQGEFASRSNWKNNKLIHSGSQTVFQQEQRAESYVQEEYSLSKNGKKITIKTTATGLNGVTKFKQTYFRRDK